MGTSKGDVHTEGGFPNKVSNKIWTEVGRTSEGNQIHS